MAGPIIEVGARKVVLSGTVICTGDEKATIKFDQSVFQISFESRAGKPPGFDNIREGNLLRVVLINADSPAGSAFVTKVGTLAGGKDFIMALFVRSLGEQVKTRLIAYTFSF